jgi:Tfp pilus assembly protein PilF
MREEFKDYLDDFALLIEAGFVAVKQLDEVSATRIFQAAQVMSPSSAAPQIGLGYVALNKLEVKEATRIFKKVTESEPENYLAQTFLGMCYLLTPAKRAAGEKIIRGAIAKSNDATIKNLGQISLEWADKDLKKEKAPFFATQQKSEEP